MDSNLQDVHRNNIGECPTCGLLSLVLVDIGIYDTNLSYDKTGWFAFVTKEDNEVTVFIDKYLTKTAMPSEEERVETTINPDTCKQISTRILERFASISVAICPECGDTCDVIHDEAEILDFGETEHRDPQPQLGPVLRKLLGRDDEPK